MRRTRILITLFALVALSAADCGALAEKGGGSSGKAGESYSPNIDPAKFTTNIDNKYFPLKPGTTFVYEGKQKEGIERNEVTVTHDTRRVMGVDCVVIKDQVFLNGSLTEDTRDWYAQDEQGNVWYFGENTKELQNGKVESTQGSWEAGVDGAKPGIIMRADPKVGETYRQEYYKGKAEDMGKVLTLTESATVPYGSFDHLLMTRDWNPIDPASGIEQKYYAPGIGNVLEVGIKGTSERVELIAIK